jgi:hypothetical protein
MTQPQKKPGLPAWIAPVALIADVGAAAGIWFGRKYINLDDQIAMIVAGALVLAGISAYATLSMLSRKAL